MIRYKQLVVQPDPLITQLEQSTGFSGIDRATIPRKINTFEDQTEDGKSPTSPVEPQSLTNHENRSWQQYLPPP